MTTWLVTGANRGIGLELARQLAERGLDLIAACRAPERAAELAELTGSQPERLDVADADSVRAFAARLRGRPVDVLVNNAGIGGPRPGLEELDFEAMTRAFQVNALGALRVVQAVLPGLRLGGDKLVVNVSSALASIEGNTAGGAYGYRASKAALNMLTRSLAAELGPEGFRCLAMSPGWVRTDMGGGAAPLSVQQSVGAMLAALDRLPASANGAFVDQDGRSLPW